MLNGEAKRIFEGWYVNKSNLYNVPHIVNFYGLPLSMQFGVYQQWADSMGYEIGIMSDDNGFAMYFNDTWIETKRTREEAQRAAIEKLNNLINDRPRD